MTKVQVTLYLEIDSDDEEQIERIINELDYDFSYCRMIDTDGTNLEEKNYILTTELDSFDIL